VCVGVCVYACVGQGKHAAHASVQNSHVNARSAAVKEPSAGAASARFVMHVVCCLTGSSPGMLRQVSRVGWHPVPGNASAAARGKREKQGASHTHQAACHCAHRQT
jgi:hypothetical protein